MNVMSCCLMAVLGLAVSNDVHRLPPVVVVASRIDARAETLPAPVAVFDAADLATSGARDIPEFLEKAANVEIRRLNDNPMQAQIALRGFGDYSYGRVKVLLDGEELNEVDMQMPDLARIPMGNVRRVEVIPGPNPVLYGDGAVAGVINIITEDALPPDEMRLSLRAGSQNTFGGNVGAQGRSAEEGLSYSATYDYEHSDGYRDRSAYDIHALTASLTKHFDNGARIGLKANYENALYEMPGALSLTAMNHDRTAAAYENDWCRTWNYGVGLAVKAKIAEGQWLYLDATYSQKYRRTNWGDYGYANVYDLYGLLLAPRYVNTCRLGRFDNTLTLGADIRYDRDNIEDASGYNNSKYHFDRFRYALYAHDEFFLTETLSITAGARVEVIDNAWRHYKNLDDTSSTDVMGDYEVALVWRPLEGLKTYVKTTRFHRSPFCDEMNYTEDGSLLEPETGWSLDVGASWTFQDEFTVSLDSYGMVIDDEIFYDPYAKDYGGTFGGYNCNSPDRTRRIGFDAGISWKRDKVAEADIRYGFTHAQFAEGGYEGCDVPLVPAHRVRVDIGVWLMDDLEIKGGYRYVASRVLAGDFANAHDALAGYSLFDIGAYYEPHWAKGWRLTVVVDNLFDSDYCDYAGWSDYLGGYYYPACGRSFLVTLSYTW